MKVENLFQVKLGTFLRKPQKNLEVHKQSPTMNVNCVVETTKLNNVLMKENLVWEQIPLALTQKKDSLMVRVKVWIIPRHKEGDLQFGGQPSQSME